MTDAHKIREEALEEAARLVEEAGKYKGKVMIIHKTLAARIRALASVPPKEE